MTRHKKGKGFFTRKDEYIFPQAYGRIGLRKSMNTYQQDIQE